MTSVLSVVNHSHEVAEAMIIARKLGRRHSGKRRPPFGRATNASGSKHQFQRESIPIPETLILPKGLNCTSSIPPNAGAGLLDQIGILIDAFGPCIQLRLPVMLWHSSKEGRLATGWEGGHRRSPRACGSFTFVGTAEAMNTDRPRILFLEPFFGGSHRDFAEGLVACSGLDFELATLPARFWKWRLRAAALHFAHTVEHPEDFDLVFTSSLTNAADLKALWGPRCPPILLYFHENQLSYPLAPGEQRDYQYGFSNLLSGLAAQAIWFNSRFHQADFLAQLESFVSRMPDFRPSWALDAIRSRTEVVYPGCWFAPAVGVEPAPAEPDPPLIIWNHRWEFDKAPEVFFTALRQVADRGIDFRLALLGERFSTVPDVFRQAAERFSGRLVHCGFVPDKEDYYAWLRRGTLVVSTAVQENFGIAWIEAVRSGCLPLAPARLAYPEILPDAHHALCLYRDPADLAAKLALVLTRPERYRAARAELARAMGRFSWQLRAPAFDRRLTALCGDGR